MTEAVVEEWIVILDDGKEREEMLVPLCPGMVFEYGGTRWKRVCVVPVPLRIAVYYPIK